MPQAIGDGRRGWQGQTQYTLTHNARRIGLLELALSFALLLQSLVFLPACLPACLPVRLSACLPGWLYISL